MTFNDFGNITIVDSHIPVDIIREPEEQLKNESREETVQDEIEISKIQAYSNDNHHNSNAKQWSIGKKRFNDNAKEGIRWLIENGLIQNTPEDTAVFLFNETDLSKGAIGDYLGDNDDFHIEVLKHFVRMHNFYSMDIVNALRRFLYTFILLGEAQKIARIIEAFSQRYYECNPDIYTTAEACYFISYAIIMLNTLLHNKNARLGYRSFTYKKFVNSLNETMAHHQMPDQNIIKNIYYNIKTNELKFPNADINSTMSVFGCDLIIIKEGWLWKQGGRFRNWKRRLFVITDNWLFYFESRIDVENLRGVISLINVGVRHIENDRTNQFCFEIFPLTGNKVKGTKLASDGMGKWIEGHHSVYRMSALSVDDRKDWIRAFRVGNRNQLPIQTFF